MNPETEIARQRLADNYFEAILEILDVCPTEEPTWESVGKSLGGPADVELVCEVYYTRKAHWKIGTKLRAALAR